MSEPILVLDDVRAGYGKSMILNGVDLSVGAHERVVVLGSNGSGKSTLAKTVMGLTTVFGGSISWCGAEAIGDPAWHRTRAGLGYVAQVNNVFRELTVQDNLLVGGHRLPRREVAERIDGLLELFPTLAARRAVSAGNLSGGERRMLALATTLIENPRLLVLDEPTSDLAPTMIDTVFDKVREICDTRKLPLLMIEQNVGRALELADRVCVLVRGKVVVERRTDEITEAEVGEIFLNPLGQHGDDAR